MGLLEKCRASCGVCQSCEVSGELSEPWPKPHALFAQATNSQCCDVGGFLDAQGPSQTNWSYRSFSFSLFLRFVVLFGSIWILWPFGIIQMCLIQLQHVLNISWDTGFPWISRISLQLLARPDRPRTHGHWQPTELQSLRLRQDTIVQISMAALAAWMRFSICFNMFQYTKTWDGLPMSIPSHQVKYIS